EVEAVATEGGAPERVADRGGEGDRVAPEDGDEEGAADAGLDRLEGRGAQVERGADAGASVAGPAPAEIGADRRLKDQVAVERADRGAEARREARRPLEREAIRIGVLRLHGGHTERHQRAENARGEYEAIQRHEPRSRGRSGAARREGAEQG